MIVRLIIPVTNTVDGKFSYEKEMSREEYFKMSEETFFENNAAVTQFVENMKNNISNIPSERKDNTERTVEDNFQYFEAEAFVQNVKQQEIFTDFFEEFSNNGAKTVVIVNINPNSIEPDAASELKYWVEDSNRVINDFSLDNKTKILSLPKTFFYVEAENEKYLLQDAKLVKDYSNKKFPMNYAILVDKITKVKKS